MVADFSLATLCAISVDRLLALLLGIRYRQVVTMKRARWCVGLILLFSIGNCFTQYRVGIMNFTIKLLWVFAGLMICYLPFGLGLLVQTMLSEITEPILIISFFGLTLVYLNSSMNPLLYCWKIREVRHAVKETLRIFGFRWVSGDWRTKWHEETWSGFVHDETLSLHFYSSWQFRLWSLLYDDIQNGSLTS